VSIARAEAREAEMSIDWEVFYRNDWVALYSLWVVPALFLAWVCWAGPGRGVQSARGRFVHVWALVYLVETLIDPTATGPLVADAPESVATGVSLLFVLLGDFRVFLLVLFLREPSLGVSRNALRALSFTVAVPVSAWAISNLLEAWLGALSPQVLWVCHEALFVVLALWLRAQLRDDRLVAETLVYVAVYYALWAVSDLLILSGVSEGWLLRVLPNQLYYAFFVPYVYVSFGWRRAEGERSQGAQAAP